MTSRRRSSTSKRLEEGEEALSTHPVGSPALGGPRLWAGRVWRGGERGVLAPPPTCWVTWGEPPTLPSHCLVARQGGANLPAAGEDSVDSGNGNTRHVVTRCCGPERGARARVSQRREVRAYERKRAGWTTLDSLPAASHPQR